VKRPDRLVLHDRDLGLAGGGPGGVGRDQAERVQAGIDRLDPVEQRGGELDGRELLVTDESGDLERRPPGEIRVDQESILRTPGIVSSGP
jgi:hypothetical protein